MVITWLMMVNTNMVGSFSPTPLKNDGVKVSWDDEIPNIWNHKQMFQTTNQLLSPLKLSFSLLESIAFRPGFFSVWGSRQKCETWVYTPHSFWLNHNQVIDRAG